MMIELDLLVQLNKELSEYRVLRSNIVSSKIHISIDKKRRFSKNVNLVKSQSLKVIETEISYLLREKEEKLYCLTEKTGIRIFERDNDLINYFKSKGKGNFRLQYFVTIDGIKRKEFAKILGIQNLDDTIMRASFSKKLTSLLPDNINPLYSYLSQYNYLNKKLIIASNYREVLYVLLDTYLNKKQIIDNKNDLIAKKSIEKENQFVA